MHKLGILIIFLSVGFHSLQAQITFKMSPNYVGYKVNRKLDDKTEKKDQMCVVEYKGDTDNVRPTLNIIAYRYNKLETDRLVVLRESLSALLVANSSHNSDVIWPIDTVKIYTDSIAKMDSTIRVLLLKGDALFFAYKREEVMFETHSIFPGTLKSRAVFDVIYDGKGEQFKAMGNSGAQFGNQTASLYSEIASGNMGWCRISLGSMITSSDISDDSTAQSEEAYQRLVTSGGNTVLSVEYPWLFAHTKNNQGNIISRFIGKGTADFPAFGTSTDKWAGSIMFGIDMYADGAVSNNSMRFFGAFNASLINGTPEYKSNLGVQSCRFAFAQATVGIVFLQNYKISFIVYTASTEAALRNKKVIAGGQVLR